MILEDFKVLIVEDEFLVSADLKHHLESMDYEVIGIASTGIDAIRIAEEKFPDIILMDIILKEIWMELMQLSRYMNAVIYL